MSDAPPAVLAEGEAPPQEEKKKRGKPKDEHAPPKPKNPYSRFCSEERVRLKEARPELCSDLAGMGVALAEGWAKVSDEFKAKGTVEYEKEMEVWKPLWAEYKKTAHYKEFVEVKTDYLDKRAQKKLVKTMNKEAPKRPKSGYMIFAGEIREGVMEKIKAEGLGLGDAGRIISERWALLTEGQKGQYGEQSQQQKVEFDKKDAVYKQTEAHGNFCDAKAKLESTQQLKKLVRVSLDDAPKRGPGAYALYRAEFMPGLTKENESKKEGEKLAMGDMTKKIAEMWAKVSEADRAKYNAEAEKGKKQYEEDFKAFKANRKYTEFLEKRAKVKTRENMAVHLREMPKKPKSVFAMFQKDHKGDLESTDRKEATVELKKKFEHASKEEKAKYEAELAKNLEKWNGEVVEYKASPKYKTYEQTKQKIMDEFKNEAIKVATLKFLSDAPAAPARSGFSIFVGEKRKASGPAAGEKKSKEAKKDEVVQAQAEWNKLPADVKKEYDDKRVELMKAYEEEVRNFMKGEKWQEYQKDAKRMKIPIKSLMLHKTKVIAKLKDGKPNPASVDLPAKPAMYPPKALNATQLFVAEKRGSVANVAEVGAMWTALSAEDKAPWNEKAVADAKRFETDMEAFRTSDDGKKYFREMKAALQRRKVMMAKNKFLGELPKAPPSALFVYMQKNLKDVKKEKGPEAKGFEIKKALSDMWLALPTEEREALELAGKEKMDEFNTKMEEFKAGPNWKGYLLMTKGRMKPKMRPKMKVKGKGKGKMKPVVLGPKAPESMPKKPSSAFAEYAKTVTGKGLKLAEMQKQFFALPEDEKRKWMTEAAERSSKYNEEMAAFEKSKEGRLYRSQTASFAKRKRLGQLKTQFLKEEPKRNQTAYFLFMNGSRATVARDHPEIKGLGPVQIKIGQMWKALNEEDRQVWLDKEKEETKVYEEKLQEFHNTDDYKKYRSMSTRLLSAGKPKMKMKAKAKAPVVKMPEKPAGMPVAPKNGFQHFVDEERKKGGDGSLTVVNKAWVNLMADGQKKYQDAAEELRKVYEGEMIKFQATMEGKKYLREKAVCDRKVRLANAKKKFLTGDNAPKEPKRPPSAYFIFLTKKSEEFKGKDRQEKAKEFTAMWTGFTPEQKMEYENQAKELKDKYDADMLAYKSSQGFKSYEKTLNIVSGKKAQMIAHAKAKRMAMEKAKAMRTAQGAKVAKPAGGAAPAAAAAKGNDSDDQMGSDSSSSSSSSSDSD